MTRLDFVCNGRSARTRGTSTTGRGKAAILAGTFRRPSDAPAPADKPEALTFRAFGATFVERASAASGKKTWKNDRGMMNRLAAFALLGPGGERPFGEKPLAAITEDYVEVFFAELRRQGCAASTQNKYLQLCKAMFRWAAKKGYLERNPLGDCEIKREKMAQRKRQTCWTRMAT